MLAPWRQGYMGASAMAPRLYKILSSYCPDVRLIGVALPQGKKAGNEVLCPADFEESLSHVVELSAQPSFSHTVHPARTLQLLSQCHCTVVGLRKTTLRPTYGLEGIALI